MTAMGRAAVATGADQPIELPRVSGTGTGSRRNLGPHDGRRPVRL